MTALALHGVSKRFGNLEVLQNIDLEVKEGEFVSIVGPSGCGKTTLLRIVAGLTEQTTGHVTVFGETPQKACKRRLIGVAFQKPALVPSRTAVGNVKMTLEVAKNSHGLSPEKLLTEFGLGDFLHHYPHQLSGGMQQRVNIACAMAHSPKVILMDEPFGALDELTRESLSQWLSNIVLETPRTTLFITHNVEEAAFLSDRVVVMTHRPGKIHTQFKVNIPKPRCKTLRTDIAFLNFVAEIRQDLYKVVNGGEL